MIEQPGESVPGGQDSGGVDPPNALSLSALWSEATPFGGYLHPDMKQHRLWDGVYRHARIPEAALARAAAISPLRLLAIAEDWCGDAANTIPVVAKLVEQLPGSELRILRRDTHRELMNRYLTNGTRSIPIVIGLDPALQPLGSWGPRPSELQAWVLANRATMPRDERYRETRRWYAQDAGVTTLDELLSAIGA